MDEFLQHMLRLGNFLSDLRNNRPEQLLRMPGSVGAQVHQGLTAAEGDLFPPLRAQAGSL